MLAYFSQHKENWQENSYITLCSAASEAAVHFLKCNPQIDTIYFCLEYACVSGMSFLCTDTKGDVVRNYGSIAEECYGYHVSVIDLRNPTWSNGNNL